MLGVGYARKAVQCWCGPGRVYPEQMELLCTSRRWDGEERWLEANAVREGGARGKESRRHLRGAAASRETTYASNFSDRQGRAAPYPMCTYRF